MATRTKHQELEDEVGILRNEVRAIGQKQDNIQSQIDAVHERLKKVDVLEMKMDHMGSLLEKNEQVHAEIFEYLKRMEGKISRPPTPDPETPSASYTVREQEILLKQHEIEQDIHARAKALAELQIASKKVTDTHMVEVNPVIKGAATVNTEKAVTVQYKSERAAQFMKSIDKGPKIDFPSFNGENPLGWIRQVTKYFELSQVPDECKVDLAHEGNMP